MNLQTLNELVITATGSMDEFRKKLRDRALIYQINEKEMAAAFCALPIDRFYHVPCDEWLKVRQQIEVFKAEAEEAYTKHKANMPELTGVTLGQIWSGYLTFCRRTKKETCLNAISKKYSLLINS